MKTGFLFALALLAVAIAGCAEFRLGIDRFKSAFRRSSPHAEESQSEPNLDRDSRTGRLAMTPAGNGQQDRTGMGRPRPADTVRDVRPGGHEAGTDSQGGDRVLAAVEAFLARTEEFERSAPDPHVIRRSPVAGANAQSRRPGSLPVPKATGVSESTANTSGGAARQASPQAAPRPRVLRVVGSETVVNAGMAVDDEPDDPEPASSPIPVIRSVEVIPRAAKVADRVEETEADGQANHPMDMNTDDPRMVLDYLASKLEQDNDVTGAWRLRLASLALEETRGDLDDASLPHDTRVVIEAVAEVVKDARELTEDPSRRADGALESANKLARLLASQADPSVPKVALCSEVVTFGVYKEISGDDLVAGSSVPAIVYLEVANFKSDETPEGDFETKLSTRLDLMTAKGESVWQHEEPEIVDRCRRYRNDFFIAQRITIPPTLAPGDYVLKVMVEDKLTGRASEGNVRFTVKSHTPKVLRG